MVDNLFDESELLRPPLNNHLFPSFFFPSRNLKEYFIVNTEADIFVVNTPIYLHTLISTTNCLLRMVNQVTIPIISCGCEHFWLVVITHSKSIYILTLQRNVWRIPKVISFDLQLSLVVISYPHQFYLVLSTLYTVKAVTTTHKDTLTDIDYNFTG